ncbi:hypothetical protein PG985_010246 [Apiospora marii]|uniref:uncharacterized protein n=1 Tax=Apiospora marii TaxID=335849 RepID=UPI00312D3F45
MTTYAEDAAHQGSKIAQLSHPFIAPLAFELKSLGKVHLLSRMADGGHLLSRLQRERRFDVERTTLFAAELVCVLEYLLEKRIVASLRPEDILIDPSGHISICSPGLHQLNQRARSDNIVAKRQESPAPKDDHAIRPTTIGDWRELGTLVCEMITGLPPILDGMLAWHEPNIRLPEGLPASARDFIQRMLSDSSESFLGIEGITGIKSHPFFHGVDWDEVPLKKTSLYRPAPLGIPAILKVEPGKRRQIFDDRYQWTGVRRQLSRGFLYEEFSWGPSLTFWEEIGRIRSEVEDETSKPDGDLAQDDNWDVDWDAELRRFHFKNRLTTESRLAYLDPEDPSYIGWRRPSPPSSAANNPPPSEGDLLEALAYGLRFGYSAGVFSQLLAYGVELNHPILKYTDLPETPIVPATRQKIFLTPLEWAVEHNRLDLVQLLLDPGGADANYSIWETRGPALRRAAYRGHQSIVEALYPKTTDRASRTRALSAAAERGDTATAAVLLALGAPCDFAESDRPLPADPDLDGQYVGGPTAPPLQAKHFYPPLVVAIWRGDAAMARLLLAHGAEPNLAYHGLECRRRERYEEDVLPMHEEPFFSCGRPAQLAMELGHGEIVGLLLGAGADVELPHGYWTARPPGRQNTLSTGHVCPLVPRKVYLAVTAGLREAAESRRAESCG